VPRRKIALPSKRKKRRAQNQKKKGNSLLGSALRAGGGIRSRAKNFLPLNPSIFCPLAKMYGGFISKF
jgi:hypothetical protein